METELLQGKGKRANNDGSDDQPDDDEEPEIDLAELATADDGGKRLDQIITRKATKIAARIAKQQIENTLTEVTQNYRVTNQFKELEKPDSEFAKAVQAEKASLAKDPMYQGMGDAALTELAAHRVDNHLLRSGKRPATTTAAEDARDTRIRRGSQPSSNGKPNMDRGKVEVDPRLASRARARGLDDKDIADAYDPKSVVGWQPGQ